MGWLQLTALCRILEIFWESGSEVLSAHTHGHKVVSEVMGVAVTPLYKVKSIICQLFLSKAGKK